MKVAFYTPNVPASHPTPSGDRTIARALISILERQGHEVKVISEFRAKQFWLRPRRLRELPEAFLSAYRTARTFQPDAWLTFVSQRTRPDPFGPFFAFYFGVPYVIYQAPYKGDYRSLRKKEGVVRHLWSVLPGHLLNWTALLAADHVVVSKRRDYEGHSMSPRVSRKLSYLPPAISIQTFVPDANDREQRRRALKIPEGACTILSVSRLSDKSGKKAPGVRFLIDCVADVHAKGHNVKLLIVGDGKTRADLKAHAESLLGKEVTFVGSVEHDQIRSYYNAADVFAFPGLGEAIGMVYLEAQASGLPVVAFANGGIPDVVRDRETGFLVEPLNRAEFVARLERLINDEGLRREMGRAGRIHVKSHHEIGEWGERLSSFLQRPDGTPG